MYLLQRKGNEIKTEKNNLMVILIKQLLIIKEEIV